MAKVELYRALRSSLATFSHVTFAYVLLVKSGLSRTSGEKPSAHLQTRGSRPSHAALKACCYRLTVSLARSASEYAARFTLIT
jgi:hypothetical protein